jgi:aconitate hydratase
MAFNIEMIEKVYKEIKTKVDKAKELTQKPLTLSEKILYSHLWSDNLDTPFTRGKIM